MSVTANAAPAAPARAVRPEVGSHLKQMVINTAAVLRRLLRASAAPQASATTAVASRCPGCSSPVQWGTKAADDGQVQTLCWLWVKVAYGPQRAQRTGITGSSTMAMRDLACAGVEVRADETKIVGLLPRLYDARVVAPHE